MRSSHAVASPPSSVRQEAAKEEREDSGSELPDPPSSVKYSKREAPKEDEGKGGNKKEEKEDSDSEVEEVIILP